MDKIFRSDKVSKGDTIGIHLIVVGVWMRPIRHFPRKKTHELYGKIGTNSWDLARLETIAMIERSFGSQGRFATRHLRSSDVNSSEFKLFSHGDPGPFNTEKGLQTFGTG